jgi:transcription termination/antitermination protein NusG
MVIFRSRKPEDIDPAEVRRIVDRLEASKGLPKVDWKVGDKLLVIEGPFKDFKGLAVEVWPCDSLRADLKIFGRSTPVDLCFHEIQKLNE